MLRPSAPGWFKQRRPYSAKPRRHQTALRAQADSCSHEPTALSPLSFQGNLETSRPRNLSVPRASQAKRRARSSKGNARLPGAFPRNRDLGGTRGRQSQRIGSVRERLCTWAASAGSCERKPAVTDAAANPSVRGRAFAAGESCGIEVPDVDSRAMRSLLCLSSADSSPRRAEVGSTGVIHFFLYKIVILSYLFAQNISLFPSLSRYSGEEKECYAKNRRKSNACCLLHT
jgi:hypothetical protein